MNKNWRNRPTPADYIPEGIDYIVGIDESGNSNLLPVQRAAEKGDPVPESEKHFTVTACNIAISDFVTAREMVMALKRKYWTDALFEYKNGIFKRVCFHSREIRGKRGAFNPKSIDYDQFICDLSALMADIPLVLYASHVDKVQLVDRYAHPFSPYDLCMTFVLERIVMDLPCGASCIIILESRGKKDDAALLDHIKNLLDNGNKYHAPREFRKIRGVYFDPKWCKAVQEQMSYWELELADLCAYPIYKYFVHGTQDKAFLTLRPKLSNYPEYEGKGLKSFPS